MAGLIIFPACFAFSIEPGQGPKLIFVTLPNVFNNMAGGRLVWDAVLPVYVVCGGLHGYRRIPEYCVIRHDLTGCTIKKAVILQCRAIILLSPAVCSGI